MESFILRFVLKKYRMRLGDVKIDLRGVLKSEYTQPNTVLKFNKSFKINIGWVLQIANKKMSSVMPFAFNAVELYVVTVNGKHWTRAKEVCKALEYNKKTAHVIRAHCSRENYAHKYDLKL